MNLKKTQFEARAIEAHGIGGGVIPIAYDPSGELRVLLGRERFSTNWKGSCRWSGFEGSRKQGESMLEATVREFHEETMGVVMPRDTLFAMLNEGKYWIRIVLQLHGDKYGSRYHTTYVVLVDWDGYVSSRFKELRLRMEQLSVLVHEWKQMKPECLRNFPEIGLVRITNNGKCAEVEGAFVHGDELESLHVHQTTRLSRVPIASIKTWDALRYKVCKFVENETHECIVKTRGVHTKFIQDVTVRCEHLEKDQMIWWSLADLDLVLVNKGQVGVHRFRPFFLPVLQTLLEELRKHRDPTESISTMVAPTTTRT